MNSIEYLSVLKDSKDFKDSKIKTTAISRVKGLGSHHESTSTAKIWRYRNLQLEHCEDRNQDMAYIKIYNYTYIYILMYNYII